MRYLPVIERHFTVISKGGEEIQCMCPWHDDHSGHLYVNARKGLYLCMVCGAKGSLDHEWEIPNLDTADVRSRLKTLRNPPAVARVYPEGWLRKFDVPTDYWTKERGLAEATVRRWCLGYDPFTDRVTIPVRDMHGAVLGVSMRRLDGAAPKYTDPKGYPKGKHLFGAWLLGGSGTVALVEGQVDAIVCGEARVPALAVMGSRLTADQVKVLQHMGVHKAVAMFDNDNAGRKATVQAYGALQGSGIAFTAGWYRDYWLEVKDPDDLSPERLRKMYHSALPILDWIERSGYTG